MLAPSGGECRLDEAPDCHEQGLADFEKLSIVQVVAKLLVGASVTIPKHSPQRVSASDLKCLPLIL